VQLYLLTFFAKTLFFIVIQQYTPGFYLNTGLSFIFIFILLKYYSKMSQNL
jgi:hypothetical protein